jgi:hypothetical protein
MINKTARIKKLAAGVVAATLALSALPSVAAEMEEIVVKGDLGSLPEKTLSRFSGSVNRSLKHRVLSQPLAPSRSSGLASQILMTS